MFYLKCFKKFNRYVKECYIASAYIKKIILNVIAVIFSAIILTMILGNDIFDMLILREELASVVITYLFTKANS